MLILFQRRQRARPAAPGERSVATTRRRRDGRYRSRNCDNLRRFGELVVSHNDGGGVMVALPRAHDRRLASQVREMQRRVAELEQRRTLLHSAALSVHANAAARGLELVQQFYVLFANGYDPRRCPQHAHTTERFLRAAMSEDVLCTEFRGVDVFLNQYEVSTQNHVSLKLALHRVTVLNNEPDGLVMQIKAEAVCTLRIKRETLERLFPAIIRDEALTQQLIGREYAVQYEKVFHLQAGRIFQHESRVDFCNGFLEMVQDPFVAMKLLEASVMTRHGHIKLDERIEEGRHELENSVL